MGFSAIVFGSSSKVGIAMLGAFQLLGKLLYLDQVDHLLARVLKCNDQS